MLRHVPALVRHSSLASIFRRGFATTPAAHQQFVVIARDGSDSKALDRRLAARPAHLEGVKKLKAAQQILLGGAILSETDHKMIGSVVLVDMPDKQAVEKWLQNDPYVKDGVWTSWEILPFKPAALG
ncbi:hypothetical protein HDU86_005723 [Geranomyces michiganensis]|nr:hypothetical protein HDU86_005723 [Geranomyces michiganensis]